MVVSSGLRREDALQRNAEVQRQKRLHVQVRLAPSNIGHRRRTRRTQALYGSVNGVRRAVGNQVAARKVAGGGGVDRVRNMSMLGYLRDRERVRLLAT